MSLIGKPFDGQRTKYCLAYCGPDLCDCGATNLIWKHPPHEVPPPTLKDIKEQSQKESDFDRAIDVVKEKKETDKCGD